MNRLTHLLYDIYASFKDTKTKYDLYEKKKLYYFEDDSFFIYRSPNGKQEVVIYANVRSYNVTKEYLEFRKNIIDCGENITYNDFEIFKLHAVVNNN
jgi:hypothetical protein